MSSNPKLRALDSDFVVSIGDVFASSLNRAIACCPNCEHWGGDFEKCRLNNLRPPANIIAFGCELFVNNDLPF